MNSQMQAYGGQCLEGPRVTFVPYGVEVHHHPYVVNLKPPQVLFFCGFYGDFIV